MWMRRRGGFDSGLVLRIVIWVGFRFESDHDRARQSWAFASSEGEALGHWIQGHWRDEDSEVGHCCRRRKQRVSTLEYFRSKI